MKVLILGGSGMLGHKLVGVFSRDFDVSTTLRENSAVYQDLGMFDKCRVFENTDAQKFSTVKQVVKDLRPDVILNAIGVIKQRADAKDIIKMLEINSVFPHKVALIAKDINARFITFSTDCVFSGKRGNYSESDGPDASDLYGKSKHLGEVIDKNCLTLRTSIIGREIKTSNSLVEWFLSNQNKSVRGYQQAIYSGFPTIVLAEIVSDIVKNQRNLEGLFHLSSEPINKFELLKLIKAKLGLNISIEPFEDFVIDRSLNSEKFRKETGLIPENWETLIGRMVDDPTPYNTWRKKIS